MTKHVPDQSLADIQRRRWSRPLVPHLLVLQCPMRCNGLITFTGRSYQNWIGPLINIHVCSTCGAEEELADDSYPRVEYRDLDGRPVDLSTGHWTVEFAAQLNKKERP